MQDVFAYAEFEAFWARFRPETPFGRHAQARREVCTDAAELEALWDRTDAALRLLDGADAVRLSRIAHHLKRLPRFPEEPQTSYDEVELFQAKKFLHNYKALLGLLDAETRYLFSLDYASEAFEVLMDRGRQSAESFYVADAYSDALAEVRAELRAADAALAEARAKRGAEIEAAFGFAFGARDFLLVPRERVADRERAERLLALEPYDETLVLVRPLRGAGEHAAAERREALLARERVAEEAVLETLSAALREELPRLRQYREAVTAFDLAFARARLAREAGLVRPVLGEGPLRVEGGRFVPCEELCEKLGVDYVPLDAAFDAGATVIFGSNMGGKTVVLKTLAFLQLCAQTGLFVPARRFETRVFRAFHYIGEGRSREEAQGLSGFGFEIRQLAEAWPDLERGALLLFDEFARTTSSREAEALISAILERLVAAEGSLALFSTHFRGVRRIPGVSYRRMRGLRREGLDFAEAAGAELAARIRLIDRRMDYRLAEDEGESRVSDAVAVAVLLGLEPAVAARADHFFKDN